MNSYPAKKRVVRASSAFTLIELLVVVSIIALLISIILPAVGRAKASANKTVCQTRLHGLGLASMTYLSEYDNSFPINGLIFPKGDLPKVYADNPKFNTESVYDSTYWRPEFGALWAELGGNAEIGTAPFQKMNGPISKTLLCPADDLNRYASTSLTMAYTGSRSTVKIGPGNSGYWSYSVNSVLNSMGKIRDHLGRTPGWADPLKATNIQNPSTFLFFIEEDERSLFNDEVFDAPAFNHGDRLTSRHQNGGNVGFGDGHVEWFNEIVFNQVPSGGKGNAALSPYTRMFFPDNADFLR